MAGANVLTATATNVAGNVSAASTALDVTLDTTAPAVTTLTRTASSGLVGPA